MNGQGTVRPTKRVPAAEPEGGRKVPLPAVLY